MYYLPIGPLKSKIVFSVKIKALLKDLRSFSVSMLIFFSLALLGEFVVGPWMGDDIPLWKILAVSLLTALMTVIPLQRRGLSHGDIFKYFKRNYFYPEDAIHSLYTKLIEKFPSPGFKLSLNETKKEIRLRRRASWQSFGEVITINYESSQLSVRIRPKYYLDLFDQGQAFETLNRIEEIIQKQIQNAE